jgi:DNA-binding transcriptional regulator GbsR (MarR family)
MDRVIAIFVDGIGAAAATSGVLTQVQGRIFALLYLCPQPLALDEIAAELQLSKSSISIQIRGLIEWHLVRRVPIGGSRKDHYEAATDLWRAMQEIMERRFRWNLRQVLATAAETSRYLDSNPVAKSTGRENSAFINARLEAMRAFFAAVDAGVGAFTQGRVVEPQTMQKVVSLAAHQPPRRR